MHSLGLQTWPSKTLTDRLLPRRQAADKRICRDSEANVAMQQKCDKAKLELWAIMVNALIPRVKFRQFGLMQRSAASDAWPLAAHAL